MRARHVAFALAAVVLSLGRPLHVPDRRGHVVTETPARKSDLLLGGIFAWTRSLVVTAAARPNQANELGLFLRTGPFWQDTARTTPATVVGQNVKCWDDVSGNGKHAVWSSGPVPILATGGGINTNAGELISPVTSADNTWTLYVRTADNNVGDNGAVISDGSTGVNTVIQPNTGAGPTCYYGVGATYDNPIADSATEGTYGISANGGTCTVFKDATEASSALTSATFGSIRLGYSGATFTSDHLIRNAALYSTTDDATARGLARTYLATA